LSLTLGSRFEHNDFTGEEFQPNARLIWTANARHTFWAAVARAVRTPSRAEDDFQVNFPGVPTNVLFPGAPAITVGIRGNRDFDAEKLTAYEIGYRTQPIDRLSIDATGFYNQYSGLRGFRLTNANLDFTHSPVVIVATLGNLASAETYGGEVSVNLRVNSAWRLRADYSVLKMQVHSDTTINLGALGTTEIAGSNPQQQVALRSWLDLPHGLEFDTTLRWVDELPSLNVPAYLGLDLRLGWRVSDRLEFSLVGQNLLDPQHPESKPSFFGSQATEVERGGYVKAVIRF
jgi:iron complex outermembrane receptor protein